VRPTVLVTLCALLAVSPAWADHGGALRTEANPVWAALVWAVGAFGVGMAVVAIVSVLIRRRRLD
jgi:hypothetical protein